VKPQTLHWWNWKFRREADAAPAAFLPVVVATDAPAVSTRVVELEANGVRIRVEPGTDVHYVAALVAAIRTAC
jgi:hypothetical protein